MSTKITVLFFGQLTDVTHVDRITIDDVPDTDTVFERLFERFPELKKHKYIVALEKEIVSGNHVVADNQTLALLPPYAGG